MSLKPIPISAARLLAEQYGYSQVVIIARAVGEGGGEHCTTYGIDKENCAVAARIGNFLKYKVMGWVRADVKEDAESRYNPEPDALCVCGHVNDEHGPSGACDIADCLCAAFEMEGDRE